MKLLRALLFFFFAGAMSGNAQSVIHFSLYELNPLFVNPAKSGDFLGTLRVGGLYREQWGFSNVTTPTVFFDSPIMNGFRKKKGDWIGIGGSVYRDVAGIGNLTTTGFYLSAAYHLDIGDKKNNRILSAGVQWGQESFGEFDPTVFNYGDSHIEGTNDFADNSNDPFTNLFIGGPGSGGGDNQSAGGKNAINAGLVFKANKKKSEETFELGFNLSNINSLGRNQVRRTLGTPPIDTTGGGNPTISTTSQVPAFFSGHLMMRRELKKDELYLEPTAFVKVSNVLSQYNVHGWLAMNLKDKETGAFKDEYIKFGLGYRYTNLSGIPTPKALLGYETDKLKVALACDIYLGNVIENSYAIELGANYIISSPPKIELPSKVFCPQL